MDMSKLNRRTMLSSLLAMPFVSSIFRTVEVESPAYERVFHEEVNYFDECLPDGTIVASLGKPCLPPGWVVMDGESNVPGSGVDLSSRFRGNLCYFEKVR